MKRKSLCAAAAAVCLAAGDARAQGFVSASAGGPPPLAWDPAWAQSGAVDYAVIAGSSVVAIAGFIAQPLPSHRSGGILFDDDVRRGLRFTSPEGRDTARNVSDVGLLTSVAWPYFVDGLVTVSWYRKSPSVAYEMTVINAQAMAIVAGLHGVTNVLASRERPYGAECGTTLAFDSPECTSSMRYRSFFSGHSALAFTSASLICYHHLKLHLLGEALDVASCIGGYGLAAMTATLRVNADLHYATDVLTGAAVGTAIGLAIPALHYMRRDRGAPSTTGAVDVRLVPMPNGLGIGGSF